METVLVVGASGNIGISVIIAARRSGYNVLAAVRSKEAETKIVDAVGSSDGITFVLADVGEPDGIQKVVDAVKQGALPPFQHVFSTVGGVYVFQDLHKTDLASLQSVMKTNFEANYLTYIATVPYLLEQANPNATWTLITGGLGNMGIAGPTTISQGTLYSLAAAASFENLKTNIRFNEINLSIGVKSQLDAAADDGFTVSSAEFAQVYAQILQKKDIRSKKIVVAAKSDIANLNVVDKLPNTPMMAHLIEHGRPGAL